MAEPSILIPLVNHLTLVFPRVPIPTGFGQVVGNTFGVRRIYSLEGGGFSHPPSSARSARTIFSNSASNLALLCSQPVKSPARRDLICCALPLVHSLSSRKPSRLSGITASTLRP